jgi:tRNA(fMet)-specific endonuclease VapC
MSLYVLDTDIVSLFQHDHPFTQPAIERYEELKQRNLKVKKTDLRIAAIVIEQDAVLVTRNARDFGRIPGLRIEDWSK